MQESFSRAFANLIYFVAHCRASAVLANLSISSSKSACIAHYSGKVMVDSCCLESIGSPGLEHLFTPITTLAASPNGSLLSSSGIKRGRMEKQSYTDMEWQRRKSSGGCLLVKGTKIRVRFCPLNGRPMLASVR